LVNHHIEFLKAYFKAKEVVLEVFHFLAKEVLEEVLQA